MKSKILKKPSKAKSYTPSSSSEDESTNDAQMANLLQMIKKSKPQQDNSLLDDENHFPDNFDDEDADEFLSSDDGGMAEDDEDDNEDDDEFGSESEDEVPHKISKKKSQQLPSDDEFSDDDFGADGEDLSELRDQLKVLSKQEDAALFREKKNVETDKQKAIHVANQQSLWQTSLQFRLRAQHPLTLSQRLPSYDLIPYFASPEGVSPIENSKVGHQKLSIAAAVTAQSLGDLIEIEREISRISGSVSASTCHEIPFTAPELCGGLTALARKKFEKRCLVDGISGPTKRFKTGVDHDLHVIEKYLSSAWDESRESRATIMNKWGKRVQVASGKAELSSIGSSLTQPLSVQVSQTMDVEGDRFIARTRLRRATKSSLGAPPVDKGRDLHEDEEERANRLRTARFDAQIFDDSDFYAVILRELTVVADSVGSGLSEAAEAQADLLRRTKLVAKDIDRKASKGRKIRFVPIPKLVNFMVPIVTPQWLAACATATEGSAVGDAQETLVDELLEGLFGQGTRLEPSKIIADNDDEELDGASDSQDEDAEEFGDVDEELYGDFEVIDDNTDVKQASKEFHLDPNVRKKSKQFTDGDKSEHFAWFK